MSDMTTPQMAAVRRVLAANPTVKVDLVRADNSVGITPYIANDPARRGSSVNVVYGVTTPRTIEQTLESACRTLTEEA